ESIIQNNQSIQLLYINLIFIALIVIFFLIYVKISRPEALPDPETEIKVLGSEQIESFETEYYKSFVSSLIDDFTVIDNINNPLFKQYVKIDCDDFASSADKWRNSTIIIPQVNYDGFLIEAYEKAEEFVFSTSIKEYLTIWNEPFGEKLMEAHKKSSASVTRVFVFDTKSDITKEFIEIMTKQEKAGIIVRIFIDRDFTEFNFPTDLSKDFTVIDKGKIIGKTVTFGRNRNAEWVFDSEKESNRFQGYMERLKKGSVKISELNDANRN
ncbi:MAG: hypothetical protein AAGF85_22575, partial [Bacteroidota bacterium]